MTHDPLCEACTEPTMACCEYVCIRCQCDLIAKVRASHPTQNPTRDTTQDNWHTYTREYRIVHTDTDTWEIREVYFDDDGNIFGWTGHATSLWGVSESDLRSSIQYKLAAFDRPALVETELPNYTPSPGGISATEPHVGAPGGNSDHDPLCQLGTSKAVTDPEDCHSCSFLATVRADERKKSALRVAAVPSFDDGRRGGGTISLVDAVVAARDGDT